MPAPPRTTFTATEYGTDRGGGCAVFLIIAGVGLAIIAIIFGFFITYGTIDATEMAPTGVEPETQRRFHASTGGPVQPDSYATAVPGDRVVAAPLEPATRLRLKVGREIPAFLFYSTTYVRYV
jgi:hypothetical protein